MTSETIALWGTVAACCLIALTDPAPRIRRWWRARHTPRPGDVAHLPQHRGEGAAPAVVAPSPVLVCGCEWLVDRPLEVTPEVALGHYLSRASRAPAVRA